MLYLPHKSVLAELEQMLRQHCHRDRQHVTSEAAYELGSDFAQVHTLVEKIHAARNAGT